MLDLALSGRNGPVIVAHISARQKTLAAVPRAAVCASAESPAGRERARTRRRVLPFAAARRHFRGGDHPSSRRAHRCDAVSRQAQLPRGQAMHDSRTMNGVISGYLASVSLAQLIARQASRNAEVQPLKLAQRQSYGSTAFAKDSKRS